MMTEGCLAGVLNGLGVIINTQMENPIIGALLFSFGLLSVIALKLPLFTGRVGFVLERKNQVRVILFFFENAIGITLTFLCYTIANPQFIGILRTKAEIKFSKTIPQMFFYAILCGILIHFAVVIKNDFTTIFAVMIFILIGAEHCIADIPYFLVVSDNPMNLLKLLTVVLGNSVGALFIQTSFIREEG